MISRRGFWMWAGATLLVRLVFMPVTLHGDLLFVHYYPHFLSYHNVWDIYGYFGDHYLARTGGSYYPPLVYYIVAFFQTLVKIPNAGFEGFMSHAHSLIYPNAAQSTVDYIQAFTRAQNIRFIFFMKLPFLLFDLVSAVLVYRLFKASARRYEMVLLWMWNPVVIFSSTFFGQYKIISCAVLLTMLLMMQKNRRSWSYVLYGVFCLMENVATFLLPAMFLLMEPDWKARFKFLGWVLLPVGLVMIPLYAASDGFVMYSYFSPRLFHAVATRTITNHFPEIVSVICKGVLAAGYGVIAVTIFVKRKKAKTVKELVPLVVAVNAAILFIVYATSITSVHYFLWVMPFFIFLQHDRENWKPALSWLLMLLLFIFNLDSRPLNLGFFIPLDPDRFFGYPSLHEWMDRILPWGKVVAASRLGFSVLSLYFAWRLFQHRIRPHLA